MPEPKVTTTVRLDPKIFDALTKAAKKTGVPFQRVIDEACREYLENLKPAA